ncbi:probable plastid-lipid-associated protein 8, chloroplastic isoform X2 [Nymphaea colorata]|uniref:probable plastid-lipid-associated protein 8, chloroplastic isoform X2 n=1 Tax=Nymphaea colorata TaxID=210225 RepID=UPI00214F1C06|nr:probable plastid-lipid-associated protein 8, chloroplastic isoform X2 [Nymphaea colorata]
MASVPMFSTVGGSKIPSHIHSPYLSAPPSSSASICCLPTSSHRHRIGRKIMATSAVPAASPLQARPTPEDLASKILSKVIKTDRGVLLSKDEHREVAEVAQELGKFCIAEPVKSPLIFGEWDVVYCSNPTSPGGGYRSAIGRLVFKANEMVQTVEAPDVVRNRVGFSAFGFIDGEVSLKGKLIVLDERWIQVIFEAPKLKVGQLEFQYGGQSEVKLQITYLDEKDQCSATSESWASGIWALRNKSKRGSFSREMC